MTNPAATPPNRAHLLTEQRNPRTMDLHRLNVDQIVRRIAEEDRSVLDAMTRAGPALSAFLGQAEPRFVAGGRIVYLGAGTSGRLGVLDASEAPPTFQVGQGRVVGIIAGGDSALRRSSESKEDDPNGAEPDLAALHLTSNDIVIGIAAGGTTPYVLGSLTIAKRLAAGCLTAMIVCSDISHPKDADHLIALLVGPEVITGSTRMKAGTATKLALNTISTTLMIREGRVFENLMVDLRATNDKLRDRAARIISTLTGLNREEAFRLLDQAGNAVKTAVLMHRRGVGREQAESLLRDHGGRLDRALAS